MKIHFKHSIRSKLAIFLLCFTTCIFFTYIFISQFFLEKYYMSKKEKMIHESYTEIHTILDNYDMTDSSIQNKVARVCESYGITLIVNDYSENVKYYYGNGAELGKRLDEIMFLQNKGAHLIENTDDFVLQSIDGDTDNYGYYELWGHFDGNRYFLIRMAVENIKESISISRTFFFYVGAIVTVISFIIAFIISGRYAKPILNLAEISEKMSEMNFEIKHIPTGTYEIDILGNSMNQMSRKLEKNILDLKKANNELQNDIAKKEETDEMRKDFISNVSHELKTPIALIQGYAEGLLDCINNDEESRNFYCEVIVDEAYKMNKMVKSLLTLTKLEFGNEQIQIEKFDIIQVMNGVLSSLDYLIKQNNINIDFDIYDSAIYVYADEFQIESVFTNYLTNAIHYAINDRIVRIFISKKDKVLRVNVFNSGNHIQKEELEKIWIKFYKIDKARTREYGGSGIGLSIVKAIMSSHGRECGVENVDGGVIFWFELDCDLG